MQWWKCYINIFDNEKTQMIEATQKDKSDMILLIWIKLLNLSAKNNNNGIFAINGNPYPMELFCDLLHKKGKKGQKDVIFALEVLESLGMLENNDGIISIKNWSKYQSQDQYEKIKNSNAERQQRYRERQKAKSLYDPKLEQVLSQISIKS